MASKRKSVGSQASPIEVKFIGNESILWPLSPPTSSGTGSSDNHNTGASEPGSSEAPPVPSAGEELKVQFTAFLRARISRLQSGPDDFVDDEKKPRRASEKKNCFAMLAIALDPSAHLEDLSLMQKLSQVKTPDDLFFATYLNYVARIQEIDQAWSYTKSAPRKEKKVKQSADSEQNEPEDDAIQQKRQDLGGGKRSATHGRPAADAKAQIEVPKWYNERCILSGLIKPHGAHIVPVRITKDADVSEIWKILGCFWPLPAIDGIMVEGREETNILPLCPDAHGLWDRFTFAIRPIEHPTDPQHRIYIQMVWLKDLDSDGGLITGNWDHSRSGSIADFRRGQDGMYPAIKHGDVYELVTQDPEERPLPSLRLLQMQYGAHKLLAGIRAAGALKAIFSDDPPDDQGPVPFNVSVPREWKSLLEAAVDAGILNDKAAQCWGRAFVREEINRMEFLNIPLPLLPANQALEEGSDQPASPRLSRQEEAPAGALAADGQMTEVEQNVSALAITKQGSPKDMATVAPESQASDAADVPRASDAAHLEPRVSPVARGESLRAYSITYQAIDEINVLQHQVDELRPATIESGTEKKWSYKRLTKKLTSKLGLRGRYEKEGARGDTAGSVL
ncbi:hypothetical protein SPI_08828 [Niveomyces insectorum RCEF 264]|uniref:HNH nuclease domain-containing protein n=1 Tax=Niveomyces insectorum RCEF 264 TaxID=1081102 RepID=A0A167MNN6_9HYPO|nr:hypothetical protein SPI_08828 [Niveomyces insectorum RCEF 264]